MTIYELTGAYKHLELALACNPDDEELEAEFAKITDDLETKAEGYAKIIRNLKANVEGYKAEEARIAERRKVDENTIKRLMTNLMMSMKETGKTKFKTDLFAFGIAKNGGKEPLRIDADVESIPDELCKVTREVDNDKMREYIKETGDLSYAHLEDRGEHLTIR